LEAILLYYYRLREGASHQEKGVRVSAEQNKAYAREAIGIWSTGDLDVADEIYGLDGPRDLHDVEAI
jgi:hypothetical protein